MNKIDVHYYLADNEGTPNEDLGSAEVLYVPRIGGRIFLKEDKYDFHNKKLTKEYKTNGEYIVTDIHQVVHTKCRIATEGEFKGLPTWETKERLEITLIEVL